MGKDVGKAISLSDNEMQEIRQIIARAQGDEAEAARDEYYEKVSSLRASARWALKSLLDKCRPLEEYRDAESVGHIRGNTILRLPGGKQ